MHAGSARDHRRVLILEIAHNDLAEHKRRLLQQNGVCAEYDLPLKRAVEVLKAARIVCMSEVRSRKSAALSNIALRCTLTASLTLARMLVIMAH